MSFIHRPTERVVDVLTLLTSQLEGMSLSEISRETNIPKSTLSPILLALSKKRMIQLNQRTREYSIGIKSFKIGQSFLERLSIIKTIENRMKNIVSKCQEICQLGILDGRDVLYMKKVQPEQSIKLQSSVGRTLPVHSTALGKSLISDFENDEIIGMFTGNMHKLTPKTLNCPYKLVEEIEKVRKEHVSYEREETFEQVMCLAVPIYHFEKVIMSLSVSIPTFRADKKKVEQAKQALLLEKMNIEREIIQFRDIDLFEF